MLRPRFLEGHVGAEEWVCLLRATRAAALWPDACLAVEPPATEARHKRPRYHDSAPGPKRRCATASSPRPKHAAALSTASSPRPKHAAALPTASSPPPKHADARPEDSDARPEEADNVRRAEEGAAGLRPRPEEADNVPRAEEGAAGLRPRPEEAEVVARAEEGGAGLRPRPEEAEAVIRAEEGAAVSTGGAREAKEQGKMSPFAWVAAIEEKRVDAHAWHHVGAATLCHLRELLRGVLEDVGALPTIASPTCHDAFGVCDSFADLRQRLYARVRACGDRARRAGPERAANMCTICEWASACEVLGAARARFDAARKKSSSRLLSEDELATWTSNWNAFTLLEALLEADQYSEIQVLSQSYALSALWIQAACLMPLLGGRLVSVEFRFSPGENLIGLTTPLETPAPSIQRVSLVFDDDDDETKKLDDAAALSERLLHIATAMKTRLPRQLRTLWLVNLCIPKDFDSTAHTGLCALLEAMAQSAGIVCIKNIEIRDFRPLLPVFRAERSIAKRITIDKVRAPPDGAWMRHEFAEQVGRWLRRDAVGLVLDIGGIAPFAADDLAQAIAQSGTLEQLHLPRPLGANFWRIASLSSGLRDLRMSVDSRLTAKVLNESGVLARLETLAISCIAPSWVELIAAPIAQSGRLQALTLHQIRVRPGDSSIDACLVGSGGVCGCVHLLERLLLRGACGHAPDAIKIARIQEPDADNEEERVVCAKEWNGCGCGHCHIDVTRQTERLLHAVLGTQLSVPWLVGERTVRYLGLEAPVPGSADEDRKERHELEGRRSLMARISQRRKNTLATRRSWRAIAFLVSFARANAGHPLANSGLAIARSLFAAVSNIL
jgi:hypothetical protein